MRVILRVLALGIFVVLVNACAPTEILPMPTPQPTSLPSSPTPALPTATPEQAATLTPAPTPTSSPIPSPDPEDVRTAVNTGFSDVQGRVGDATLLCARHTDTDADGEPEWLAVVYQGTAPRLSAFIFDGDATYELEPGPTKPGAPYIGLGQYLTCEVEVRDVNVDGRPEIAIFGHADDNETLLHLYAWGDGQYRRLGFFSGNAGIHFEDADGDLEEEILEGYRERDAPSLAWYVIHTWEEQTYGWTSDRYDWYYLDRPHTYPVHKPEYAVISFYLALNDRDLPGAYDLLMPQGDRSYEPWVVGFATTVQVYVGGVHVIPGTETENRARVAAMVTSWDNVGGVIFSRLWNTEWNMIRTSDGWKLVDAKAELLKESIATYWP